jgi:hypothetical protein
MCVYVGPTLNDVEVLYLRLDETDPDKPSRAGLVNMLAAALSGRLGVVVTHDSASGEIQWAMAASGEGYCPP